MIDQYINSLLLQALVGVFAGGVMGTFHFKSLILNVEKFASGQILPALVMQFIRFAGLGLGLYGLVRWGMLPLLSGLVGLMLIRWWILRNVKVAG